ncbi:MAG: hypothetical protein WAS75_14675 [Candidatus Microthrix subdominans]
MLVGHREIQGLLANELGSEYLGKRVAIPSADEVEDHQDGRIAAGGYREISESSLLAAALYRFSTSNFRGASTLKNGTGNAIEILDALKFALSTMEGYSPEKFQDVDVAGDIEEARRHDVEEDS